MNMVKVWCREGNDGHSLIIAEQCREGLPAASHTNRNETIGVFGVATPCQVALIMQVSVPGSNPGSHCQVSVIVGDVNLLAISAPMASSF